MRAGIYCRLSLEKHKGDTELEGFSVAGQEQECRDLADRVGWTVADVYSDNDVSATSSKPRPQYERLLADIKTDKIGAIICWHPDRLYRRPADLEQLIDLCNAHDVAIRTVRAGEFDLSTPSGRMVARIIGSVATGEVEHKADRQRRATRQRREAGFPPGGRMRMYGWTRTGDLIDTEADEIRRMADAVLAGQTLVGICRDLTERGTTTTAGGQWTQTAIRHLLRNPRLAGHATYRGKIIGRGKWPPILDDDIWQTVVAFLDARSHTRPPRVALLAGLICCGRCGELLVTGQRNDRIRTYRCPPAGPARVGCGGISGTAEPIEQIVEGYARGRLADPRIRRAVIEAQSSGHADILAAITAQERQLAELDAALEEPGKHVTRLLKAADAVEDRITALRRQLADATETPIPDDVDLGWPTDLGPRRRLVDLVVARVWLDPGRGGRFNPRRVRVDPAAIIGRV